MNVFKTRRGMRREKPKDNVIESLGPIMGI